MKKLENSVIMQYPHMVYHNFPSQKFFNNFFNLANHLFYLFIYPPPLLVKIKIGFLHIRTYCNRVQLCNSTGKIRFKLAFNIANVNPFFHRWRSMQSFSICSKFQFQKSLISFSSFELSRNSFFTLSLRTNKLLIFDFCTDIFLQ